MHPFNNAKSVKNDEFYTKYEDIEEYLKNFTDDFKGKRIYCNCDSKESEFYRYFKNNYNNFQLSGLTISSYNKNGFGSYTKYDGTVETTNKMFFDDGGFDCLTSIDLLKECDMVVTNPPFSKFIHFYNVLKKSGKKFITMGNNICFTYRNIYKDVVEHRTFLSDEKRLFFKNNTKQVTCCWLNNIKKLDFDYKDLKLTKDYDPEIHKECDNYKWIFVKTIKDIPKNYNGLMGVPITIFHYKQFYTDYDFICFDMNPNDTKEYMKHGHSRCDCSVVDGKNNFSRAIVKRKQIQK